jgi:hypothetical protein
MHSRQHRHLSNQLRSWCRLRLQGQTHTFCRQMRSLQPELRSPCRPRTATRKLVSKCNIYIALASPPTQNSATCDTISLCTLASPPPTLTCWQSATLTEPTTVLYDPAAHPSHSTAPMAALAYVPLGHSVQAVALVPAGVELAFPASHCNEGKWLATHVSLALLPLNPHLLAIRGAH